MGARVQGFEYHCFDDIVRVEMFLPQKYKLTNCATGKDETQNLQHELRSNITDKNLRHGMKRFTATRSLVPRSESSIPCHDPSLTVI